MRIIADLSTKPNRTLEKRNKTVLKNSYVGSKGKLINRINNYLDKKNKNARY